jgi:pimeloyl-ACP methyl ester carboxylesterase
MLIPHSYGTPNQPALLLMHAGGTLHSVWQPFIREWSQHFSIFAPDLFVDLKVANPLQALASEVRDWLDENAIDQIDVIGTSLGANVALYLAIEDPQRIKHLVLDSGQAGAKTPPMPLLMLTKILCGVFAVMPQSLITRGLMTQFKRYSPEDRRLIQDEMIRLGKYGFVESIEAHLPHYVGDRLNRISTPTLILEGSSDTLTRQGMGEALQKGIMHARRETIKDAGHVTFLSQPEMFRRHVEAFLMSS